MNRLPIVNHTSTKVKYVTDFRGLNLSEQTTERKPTNSSTYWLFHDMQNMTSDLYPIASSSKKQEVMEVLTQTLRPLSGHFNGIYIHQDFAYIFVDTSVLKSRIMNGSITTPICVGTCADSIKHCASIGKYIFVVPDNIVIDTEANANIVNPVSKTYTHRNFNAKYGGRMRVSQCLLDGSKMPTIRSESEPQDKTKYWYDTEEKCIKKYNSLTEQWQVITTTYLKFKPEVRVVEGETAERPDALITAWKDELKAFFATLSPLETIHIKDVRSSTDVFSSLTGDKVIYAVGEDYIIIQGFLVPESEEDTPATSDDTAAEDTTTETVEYITRLCTYEFGITCPTMDYVCAHKNRIWGCSVAGNEIFACKQGNPFQWNNYPGIASDSYAVNVGTNTKFTGATEFGSTVLFFKHDRVYKVYGDYPSNFQVAETMLYGVQEGSADSMCMINGVLYYLSDSGIMRYDGSLPQRISDALGEKVFSKGVGTNKGNKYLLSVDEEGHNGKVLYVYDTEKGFFHKEHDAFNFYATYHNTELFTIISDRASSDMTFYRFSDLEQGEGYWMLETGWIGLDSPYAKYISKMQLRVEFKGNLECEIAYDNDGFEPKGRYFSEKMKSFTIPIRTGRNDRFRLKLKGNGKVKLYSIAYNVQQGSEKC